MTLSPADHKKRLQYIARGLGDCLADIRIRKRNVPVVYNVDFSLLCPVLFDRPAPGSKDFLTSTKGAMRRVLAKNREEAGFQLAVSGATIVEFYDQLEHLLHGIRARIPALRDKYLKEDEMLLRKALMTSQEINDELHIITQSGIDKRVREPINRLLHYLDTGKLKGIGDVLDSSEVRKHTNKEMYDIFLGEQKARRLSADQRMRADEDSMFHYKIDAINNCLTLAAAKTSGVRAPFVTTSPLNMEQCTVDGSGFGRLDRTPLFMLNLSRMKQSGEIGDETEYLRYVIREALELAEDLEGLTSLDECPNSVQVRLANFYQGPLKHLSRVTRKDEPIAAESNVDEIVTALKDEGAMKRILEEVTEDIRTGAKLVEISAANFDISYVEEFNFGDDPVLEKIKKDLDIKM